MTRDKAKRTAEVLTWFADGGGVQYLGSDRKWKDYDEYCAFGLEFTYRKEPKPREFWCYVYEGGGIGNIWLSRKQAEHYGMGRRGTIIKVREVLDDE